MVGHDIIVIGASAGGVEACSALVRALPPDLPAAVFVVLHIAATTPSLLPTILGHAGALPAQHPATGTPIEHGQIYVAPPDHHLLVERGHVHVLRGPKENSFRPAIDATLRTAAQAYGPRVVGVVLTGMLDDGTAGLRAVKRRVGVALVQAPRRRRLPEHAAQRAALCGCGCGGHAGEFAVGARSPRLYASGYDRGGSCRGGSRVGRTGTGGPRGAR